MTPVDVSIVIPCYNEGPNITAMDQTLFPVVARLAERSHVEVVMVDDGSHDDTLERLHALAAVHPELVVLAHPHNLGSGAAFRTGFAAARGEVVVTTDADATYRFDEIPNILELCEPEVDIVTGSPYHPRGAVENVPSYRVVLSRGASTLYRWLLGGHLYTYTSFFRVYRRQVLQTVPVRSNDFLAVAQLLVEASLQGYRIVEYPTVLHVRRFGQSKARIVRLSLKHLRFMLSVLRHQLGRAVAKARYGESA